MPSQQLFRPLNVYKCLFAGFLPRALLAFGLLHFRICSQLLRQLHHQRSADVSGHTQPPNLGLCLDGSQHQRSSCISCKHTHLSTVRHGEVQRISVQL